MAIKDVILGYAKGEKGDPGPRGEKGNTGATGPKGDPGNIADAQITDTEGLDVAKGQKTTAQKLFDAIANRIVTKLVTNDALTKKLADYMLKGMMSNTNVNNTGTVPTSALMYSMFEQIVTKLVTNDALTKKLADYMLKGMMSNTNVNNTGTVPTSALMYSMFEQINNNLHMTSESKRITVNGNQHNIKIDKIGNLLCVCNITLNTVTFNGSAFDVYTDPFDVSYRPKSTCVSPLSINGGEAMMEVMMLPVRFR